MKCPICGNEHNERICIVCGFDKSLNYIDYATVSPVAQKDLDYICESKKEWEIMAATNVYLNAHYYKEIEDDRLEWVESREILVANGKGMKAGTVIWSDIQMPRMEGMEVLTFCLVIRSGRNQELERKIHVMIDNPHGNSKEMWKVGIVLMDKRTMNARIVLGTEKSYQTSDDFCLIHS